MKLAFTFFFRDQQVLERAVEYCLPIIAGRNHPRVWDAGVARGQEPYTVAIMFAERDVKEIAAAGRPFAGNSW